MTYPTQTETIGLQYRTQTLLLCLYLECSGRGDVTAEQEVWGSEVPQRGLGAEPVGVWGRIPQKL